MNATDLLRESDELDLPDVERWVAASLAEAAALRAYENQLCPLSDDPALMRRARRAFAAILAWADATEPVYRRVRQDPALAHHYINGLADLRMALLRARSAVDMTPEEFLRRYRRVEAGEGRTYHSIEELRLELGLPPKSRRSA